MTDKATAAVTKQGIRNLNPTNKQTNGRSARQHQFEPASRIVMDAVGAEYSIPIKCCKHCGHEIDCRANAEIEAHYHVTCRGS